MLTWPGKHALRIGIAAVACGAMKTTMLARTVMTTESFMLDVGEVKEGGRQSV
jgi:hypothetical protein